MCQVFKMGKFLHRDTPLEPPDEIELTTNCEASEMPTKNDRASLRRLARQQRIVVRGINLSWEIAPSKFMSREVPIKRMLLW